MPQTSHGKRNKNKINSIIKETCQSLYVENKFPFFCSTAKNQKYFADRVIFKGNKSVIVSYKTQYESGTAEQKIEDHIKNIRQIMKNSKNCRENPIFAFVVLDGDGFNQGFIQKMQKTKKCDWLEITTIEDFREFCEEGKLADLFDGHKTEINVV